MCVGAGVYPAAALLNHSCAPNCAVSHMLSPGCPPTLAFRLLRTVQAGEEVCHNFVDLAQCTASRKEQLLSRYRFECACERCVGSKAGGYDLPLLEGAEGVAHQRRHWHALAAQPHAALVCGGCDLSSRESLFRSYGTVDGMLSAPLPGTEGVLAADRLLAQAGMMEGELAEERLILQDAIDRLRREIPQPYTHHPRLHQAVVLAHQSALVTGAARMPSCAAATPTA